MEKIQILLVDQNHHDRAVCERDLRMEDFWEIDLLEAETAAEADLVLENAHHIDCIMLALKLPDAHGFDLLRKWIDKYPDLPAVVILTRYGGERAAVEAIKSGAFEYVNKNDYSSSELARIVRQGMHLTRLRRELVQQRTMRSQAEAELRDAQQNSGELSGVRRVVATFMHEINSPITGVSCYLKMLLEDEPEKELRGIYEEMLEACDRIKRVLDSMIDLKELHAREKGKFQGPLDLRRHVGPQHEAEAA